MPLKIKILMMLKNEDDLLLKWGVFHGNMVGYENIIIFDNGSNSKITLDALFLLETYGVIVIRDKNSRDDFYNKGIVISNYIKECDANDPADFYFPLDCDEFLGTGIVDQGGVSFEIEDISKSLEIYLNSPDILMIGGEYGNYPGHPDMFRFSPTQRKCFFAKGACDTLNRGYHQAKSLSSTTKLKTDIIYMHFHYKPFELLQEHSRQKLEGQIDSFDAQSLIRYRDEKKPGFHLVSHLLYENESEYLSTFNASKYVSIPELRVKFSELDILLPFC